MSAAWRAAPVCLLIFALARPAGARRIRVATFNVEHGIGEPGSPKYEAQLGILRRIDADIVAFQELKAASSNEWVRLSRELGYAHRAWGETGPFAGTMELGFFSRYPIRETASVDSPPGARELSRRPLRVRVDVEGAARPVVLWNVHLKAMYDPRDDFRRAVEALRVAQDIERFRARHPDIVEFILMGDVNDAPTREDQSDRIEALPAGLPATYTPGADLRFPLPYRGFPVTAFARVGPGFRPIDAFRRGTDIDITQFYTNLRLDWIFASEPIWNHPKGPPRGEIYHSEWDAAEGGLPLRGAPLPPAASLHASDHYAVFADLYLQAAPEEAAK